MNFPANFFTYFFDPEIRDFNWPPEPVLFWDTFLRQFFLIFPTFEISLFPHFLGTNFGLPVLTNLHVHFRNFNSQLKPVPLFSENST